MKSRKAEDSLYVPLHFSRSPMTESYSPVRQLRSICAPSGSTASVYSALPPAILQTRTSALGHCIFDRATLKKAISRWCRYSRERTKNCQNFANFFRAPSRADPKDAVLLPGILVRLREGVREVAAAAVERTSDWPAKKKSESKYQKIDKYTKCK